MTDRFLYCVNQMLSIDVILSKMLTKIYLPSTTNWIVDKLRRYVTDENAGTMPWFLCISSSLAHQTQSYDATWSIALTGIHDLKTRELCSCYTILPVDEPYSSVLLWSQPWRIWIPSSHDTPRKYNVFQNKKTHSVLYYRIPSYSLR